LAGAAIQPELIQISGAKADHCYDILGRTARAGALKGSIEI